MQFWELPGPGVCLERNSKRISALSAALVFGWFLRQMTFWQNSICQLMEMEPLQSAYPYRTALIAIVFGALLIATVRTLLKSCSYVAVQLNRFLPPRISWVLSAVFVGFLFLSFVNGVLARRMLSAADTFFAGVDGLIDDGVEQPALSSASGSPESLIAWDSIGRRGKNFIVGGPTQEQLTEFSGPAALQPLRVYVGLRSQPTQRQRAELALEELKRAGAFDRSLLVVATPTGTGWLDPSAVDTLEYLHAGNTAIVSMQYLYLPSWLTIMVDPNRSRDTARILFDEIYDHWTTLPPDSRPRLYVHGLSLGALGSEVSADLFTIFEDPIHGAVWSGPPFASRQWRTITGERNQDTPAWLPEFRDGAMVRFTGQQNSLQEGKRWGPIRSVYIQYASDPMVFFSPDLLFHKPDWLIGHRGPDVSPYLEWYPIVTCLQIAFDLPMATSVPLGYGHNYSPANYLDAWIAVTAPAGWSDNQTRRLKELFADRPLPM
ncbi:MAG: hypothetical protein GY903_19465 [Fuerstiella sp.]|nr:hypothetical protein [Fuerstiella sp.]MCP4856665.1 hypothetical protein [Fuerstiella sp.]